MNRFVEIFVRPTFGLSKPRLDRHEAPAPDRWDTGKWRPASFQASIKYRAPPTTLHPLI